MSQRKKEMANKKQSRSKITVYSSDQLVVDSADFNDSILESSEEFEQMEAASIQLVGSVVLK